MNPATVALTQGLHQLGVLLFFPGVEPLLELVEDDQHLPAHGSSLAAPQGTLLADTPPPSWTGAYFTGVPAPAGALLALIPLMVSFEIEAAWPRHALVVGTVLVVVGGLMVSRLPTFSFKKGRVPRHLVLPAMLAAALMMGVLASSPWIGLSLLGLGYASLIPFSWIAYQRQAALDRKAMTGDVVTLRAVDSGLPPRD